MRTAPAASSRLAGVAALALVSLPALAGCGGDEAKDEGQTPQEALAQAAETLTGTSGVQLDLTTEDLPAGVTGIVEASGTALTAPAFEGTISVVLAGNTFEVPVIAVDDTVYAQIPLTPGWNEVDPADYGAPDPAALIDGQTGFPALLGTTEGLEEGESVRGGADNDEILTTYTGSVTGTDMAQVIPSAAGESFDVEWQVTDEGELRQADLTGVFYPDSTEMTYTVTFADYGTEKDITAP